MQRIENTCLLQDDKQNLTNSFQRITQLQNHIRPNATMKRSAAIIIPEDFDYLEKKVI